MSSILDALQKVEREKGRAEEPQDLDELLDAIDEDELVAANLLGRPPEPTFPRWLPAAGAATALLIGLSAAAVAYYPQMRNPRDPSREPVRTQVASRQPSQPEAGRTVAQGVRPEPAAGPESGARPTPAPEMEPRPEPAPHVQPTDSSPVAPPLPATSQPDATVQEAAPETGVEAAPVAPPPPPNAAPPDPPNTPGERLVAHVQPSNPYPDPAGADLPSHPGSGPESPSAQAADRPSARVGAAPARETSRYADPPVAVRLPVEERRPVNAEDVRAPADPTALDRLTAANRDRLGLPDIEVTYVGAVGPRSSALINYQIHYVGDYVGDTNARVIDITRRGVAIEVGGERYFVPKRR